MNIYYRVKYYGIKIAYGIRIVRFERKEEYFIIRKETFLMASKKFAILSIMNEE